MKWINQGVFPPSLNDIHITLIAKCDNPTSMKDLRPISLCNFLYKIVAKVLANRLKMLLPQAISESQVAFVPGCSIIDNAMMAFEIIHFLKRKTKGKSDGMASKVAISKAYDRIDWGFLERIMLKMGFDHIMRDYGEILCVG